MPERSLRILIVDENRLRASIIEEGLRDAGHSGVTIVDVLDGVMRRVVEIDPDVIVMDIENPSRDALESLFHVSRAAARPVAMFVDQSDASTIEAAVEAGVSAYVVDGLRKDRVKTIVDLAISRFNAYSRLRVELDNTRQQLEERKYVDRAKGLLMKLRGLSEEEAYQLLRRTAMNENRRLVEVAHSVITAASMFGGD